MRPHPSPRRTSSAGRRTIAARVVLPLYLAVIGVLTLAPIETRYETNETMFGVLGIRTWLDPETWSSGRPWEFLANIALFVPLGILLRMAFPRARIPAVILGAVAITGGIEVLQLPLDRVSDPRDLVANSLGGLIGVVLATRVRRQPAPARSPGG